MKLMRITFLFSVRMAYNNETANWVRTSTHTSTEAKNICRLFVRQNEKSRFYALYDSR